MPILLLLLLAAGGYYLWQRDQDEKPPALPPARRRGGTPRRPPRGVPGTPPREPADELGETSPGLPTGVEPPADWSTVPPSLQALVLDAIEDSPATLRMVANTLESQGVAPDTVEWLEAQADALETTPEGNIKVGGVWPAPPRNPNALDPWARSVSRYWR